MTARRARPRVLYVVEDARWPGVVIQQDVFDELAEAERELARIADSVGKSTARAGTIHEYVRKTRPSKARRRR